MKLYLIRHGEPIWEPDWKAPVLESDELARYSTPPGPGLSNLGYEQARQAAKFVTTAKISKFYCSGLLRAMQTCKTMHNGNNIEWWPEFNEKLPSESTLEFTGRVLTRLNHVCADPRDNIALIAHLEVIAQILHYLGWNKYDLDRMPKFQENYSSLPHCGIFEATISNSVPVKLCIAFVPTEYNGNKYDSKTLQEAYRSLPHQIHA